MSTHAKSPVKPRTLAHPTIDGVKVQLQRPLSLVIPADRIALTRTACVVLPHASGEDFKVAVLSDNRNGTELLRRSIRADRYMHIRDVQGFLYVAYVSGQ